MDAAIVTVLRNTKGKIQLFLLLLIVGALYLFVLNPKIVGVSCRFARQSNETNELDGATRVFGNATHACYKLESASV